MRFDIREIDLDKLNSLTKYPSIPTYHAIGEKGMLQPTIQVCFCGTVYGSEKVDGTNARIIMCPDGSILLGSREDLLWESRDLIGNPSMGIVETLRNKVAWLARHHTPDDAITVFFVEVYGKNVGSAAKQYSGKATGFRLFDVLRIEDHQDILGRASREQISNWRENGYNHILGHGCKATYADVPGLIACAVLREMEMVPQLFSIDAGILPSTFEDAQKLIQEYQKSRCALDESGLGSSEGIVIRTADRSAIAKLRQEDYARTLRRLAK